MAILTAKAHDERRLITATGQSSFSEPADPVTMQIGKHCVVMSGWAEIEGEFPWLVVNAASQPSEETEMRHWDVHVLVGPKWRGVEQVSPMVAPAHFYSTSADEDDVQGFQVRDCDWEEVEDDNDGVRIRLKFPMWVWGEDSRFTRVVYQVAATGHVMEW